VSVKAAWAWLLALCAFGLVVLFQLRLEAQLVALASLVLVAAYPFMKRVTWWPQAWLGLVFTWGALVGWTALRSDRLEVIAALYAGSICWCIGYDTIYALQDREDDALVGIRSSALRLGRNVRAGVISFYALALAGWGLAFWLLREDELALLALLPAAAHLMWQAFTLDPADPDNPLARFRSNRFAGLLVAAACFVVGNA
jgi:4-hydroxybenzoate polyprenyltransferase